MDNQTSPNISSFVIRFVHPGAGPLADPSEGGVFPYRGAIRHIQSDQEITFTRWEDAVDFIQRFVPLELEK